MRRANNRWPPGAPLVGNPVQRDVCCASETTACASMLSQMWPLLHGARIDRVACALRRRTSCRRCARRASAQCLPHSRSMCWSLPFSLLIYYLLLSFLLPFPSLPFANLLRFSLSLLQIHSSYLIGPFDAYTWLACLHWNYFQKFHEIFSL